MINIFQIPQIPWFVTVTITLLVVGAVMFLIGFIKGRESGVDAGNRSKKLSRSALGGLFSEQVAPFLSNFPSDLKASEARFIGKPIDFLIFKGMDDQNISEVVFVEIKTGRSQLTTNERKLRDAVNEKRVRWYEYRVDEGVSKLSEPVIEEKGG